MIIPLAWIISSSHETPTARSRRREEADSNSRWIHPPLHVGGYGAYEICGPARLRALLFVALFAGSTQWAHAAPAQWMPLFPTNGILTTGWTVRAWNDVSKPGPTGALWRVEGGVLTGSAERGSWLMSEREFADFVLEFDFKLGSNGNSGCALRAPMAGDPAFDGMELQMADYRYNTNATPSELTGGIYRAIPPTKQVYKPTEWNHYRVILRGPRFVASLNGERIHDLDLSTLAPEVKRHDGTLAPPVKDRPRRGHIGFQNLSRGNDPVLIRNARLQVLD